MAASSIMPPLTVAKPIQLKVMTKYLFLRIMSLRLSLSTVRDAEADLVPAPFVGIPKIVANA